MVLQQLSEGDDLVDASMTGAKPTLFPASLFSTPAVLIWIKLILSCLVHSLRKPFLEMRTTIDPPPPQKKTLSLNPLPTGIRLEVLGLAPFLNH